MTGSVLDMYIQEIWEILPQLETPLIDVEELDEDEVEDAIAEIIDAIHEWCVRSTRFIIEYLSGKDMYFVVRSRVTRISLEDYREAVRVLLSTRYESQDFALFEAEARLVIDENGQVDTDVVPRIAWMYCEKKVPIAYFADRLFRIEIPEDPTKEETIEV